VTARKSSRKTAVASRRVSRHFVYRKVRELVRKAVSIQSSVWALAELHTVLHRRLREGILCLKDARELASGFFRHIEDGLWNLIPVNEALLRRASALMVSAPRDLFIRTADAVHLTTAQDIGEHDVWTNDRHMLAAASYFGLTGRSV
jgi:predicted nucleic acid-binding protein